MSIMTYADFNENEIIKYGTAATSASVNHAPLLLKRELNNLHNYVKVKFSESPLLWDPRASYNVGDMCEYLDVVYVAIAPNSKSPVYDEVTSGESTIWSFFDAHVAIETRFVHADSEEYIGLLLKDDSHSMVVHGDNTNAIMSPKNGFVAWDNGISSNLGSPTKKFNNIYAIDAAFVALDAKYADLAEMYLADAEYTHGTVLGLGGDKEVTEFKAGMKLAGVVSTAPGFKLNSELEDGTYVTLKGRVPCKVQHEVKKGQYVIAQDNGLGMGVDDYSFETSKLLLGVALSDSKDNVVEIKI